MDAHEITKYFFTDDHELVKELERKIICFAQQFENIDIPNKNIFYPQSIDINCQLIINLHKNYNELITVIGVEWDEITFKINGIINKKDILFFEPIILTKEILFLMEFEETNFGWFLQKETKFHLMFKKTQLPESVDDKTPRFDYEFFRIKAIGNKKYKLKIRYLHQLQTEYMIENGLHIGINYLPLDYQQ